MIAAVTFDFWDTLVVDDSDEAERAARGLPTKAEARAAAFIDMVRAAHPELEPRRVREALDGAEAWFRRCWRRDHHTPSVARRFDVGLELLGIERPPGFDRALAAWEELEVALPPKLSEGVAEMLEAVGERWAVGIISDTIVSPGRSLRRILADYGLLHHFRPEALIFSDEVGAAKPAPRVFELAAAAFGAPPSALVHVGDREANDVDGPLAAGWKAVRYTGAVDRGGETRASAVCAHYGDLPAIIAQL